MTTDLLAGVCAAAAVLLAAGAYRLLAVAADDPQRQRQWTVAAGAGISVAALVVVACARPAAALAGGGLTAAAWLMVRAVRGTPSRKADIVVRRPLLGDATSPGLAAELARLEARRAQQPLTRPDLQ
jgi:hypothetical protein